jgi:hypothetical protein
VGGARWGSDACNTVGRIRMTEGVMFEASIPQRHTEGPSVAGLVTCGDGGGATTGHLQPSRTTHVS